jgi:SNF2 family DNA or RNA helicase
MALASLLLEDGLIDTVLLICEKNKMVDQEWPRELNTYTDIDWIPYEGTVKKRAKLRAAIGDHQLYLASYDTIRNDCAIFEKGPGGGDKKPQPAAFIECLEGRRVLVIYDETTKISNRKSKIHKAHKLLVDCLRQTPGFRILVLTATPMEKDPQSYFNLSQIVSPETTPTVEVFKRDYVSSFDIYGEPSRFRNLNESEDHDIAPLRNIMAGITLRKRKTDPDVIDFFPKRRELEPTFVNFGDLQQKFYSEVAKLGDDMNDWERKQLSITLRQIAGHPSALLNSQGEISKAIVDAVTPDGIRAIPSAKTEKMVEWADTVVRDQGAQAVIFTYWGQSVLPYLKLALEEAKYSVIANHGGMSQTARSEAQRAFRAGEGQIFLTSDIGQKGINLPEATYLLHYERPTLHSQFIQRSDRIHRIDSLAEAVFIYSLIAQWTIEEGLFRLGLRRNEWNDQLSGDDELEDENFISADDRKELLKIGRLKAA